MQQAQGLQRLIHSNFVEHAVRQPDRLALLDRGHRLSYGTLLQRASRLAVVFEARSRGSNRPIAIIGDKTRHAVEAMLAALLTGRAYSFLNPAQRAPRLRRMLELLRPSLVVDLGSVEFDHAPEAMAGGCALLRLPTELPADALQPITIPDGPAYVLFTSGSTGQPRGVIVGHRAASAAQRSFVDTVGLDKTDIVANEVALNFDVSTFDIFATLSVGATLDLTSDVILNDPASLLEYIERNRITTIFTVPTVARMMLDAKPDAAQTLLRLKRLMLTGELISARLAKLMAPLVTSGQRVWNLYGATEFPWGLSRRLAESDLIQPNVLDRAPSDAAVAAERLESGELMVQGDGLSSGYLTQHTDFSRPCIPLDQFATGDFAEPMVDGRYRLLGRRDRQIRRDGHRIELREIENWIESHSQVDLCFVTYDLPTNSFIAHVTMRGGASNLVVDGTIGRFTRQVLPSYMVPDRIDFLVKPPRTLTGKKDYTRLNETTLPA